MLRQGSVLAIIQAGGEGSRLDVLTRERAKPALAYGGSHRLIDFALSAMVHAELDDVWVSVQYQVESIDEYLSGGRPWSLDRNRGGFRRMVPQTGTGTPTEEGFASGNADLMLKLAVGRTTSRRGAPRGRQRRPRLQLRPAADHRGARRRRSSRDPRDH
ncbi:MAG: sugar phosphate nucleotidyltransferase [Nocardioides sp.]